jgi:hypothetical protein
MTTKISTFGGQLKHFAESVDSIDDNTFERLRDLVVRYVTNEMKGKYFELLGEQYSRNGQVNHSLRTLWSSRGEDHTLILSSSGRQVRRPASRHPVIAAFADGQPIWLVTADHKPLNGGANHVDKWSEETGLARYRPWSRQVIRTLFIVPISFRMSRAST